MRYADHICAHCTDAANLMTGADDDTGEVEIISDSALDVLLDRSELQPGDEAYCADELLGEVKPCCIVHPVIEPLSSEAALCSASINKHT